jgi:hypothetical protein
MRTVIGIFADKVNAETAIDRLNDLGYKSENMSLIMKENIAGEKTIKGVGVNMAEGAASGVATGGVIGGITGFLIGAGMLAIPGLGALFIGGPLAATLGLTGAAATAVSAAATGALAGGVIGILIGIGLPEETARIYETKIIEGGLLLAVPANTAKDETAITGVFQELAADQIKALDWNHR